MIKPRKPKKPHPAEIAAEAQMIDAIRNAQSFIASLFVGRGQYEKLGAPTVLGALAAAEILEGQHVASTRRAIIYAVGFDNIATMITYGLIEKLRNIHISTGKNR